MVGVFVRDLPKERFDLSSADAFVNINNLLVIGRGMPWEDQGRQEHGWFGDGTSAVGTIPATSTGGDLFQPGARTQRIQAVIHGATGALPAALRNHPAARPNAAAVDG